MSTRENVHKWRRYFLLFFSDASKRRVWLSAESKILASTFGRFHLYRLTSRFQVTLFLMTLLKFKSGVCLRHLSNTYFSCFCFSDYFLSFSCNNHHPQVDICHYPQWYLHLELVFPRSLYNNAKSHLLCCQHKNFGFCHPEHSKAGRRKSTYVHHRYPLLPLNF